MTSFHLLDLLYRPKILSYRSYLFHTCRDFLVSRQAVFQISIIAQVFQIQLLFQTFSDQKWEQSATLPYLAAFKHR